jgi:hypothetical protein
VRARCHTGHEKPRRRQPRLHPAPITEPQPSSATLEHVPPRQLHLHRNNENRLPQRECPLQPATSAERAHWTRRETTDHQHSTSPPPTAACEVDYDHRKRVCTLSYRAREALMQDDEPKRRQPRLQTLSMDVAHRSMCRCVCAS